MWRKQVQALSPRYRCLVPDLPEQGQSLACGVYSTEKAADLVAALIRDNVKEGKAHLVGLSEGAQVVVCMLSRHPDVIESAFISSAILRPLPGAGLYTEGLFKLMHRWFIEPFKNNDWWIKLNMHYSAGIPDEFYEDFKRCFQQGTESSTTNMLLSGLRYRMPVGLENFHRKALVVTGSKEYTQMKESARDLLKSLPNVRGISVDLGPKATLAMEHNWAMTVPDLFSSTITAFIENKDLPVELKKFN